MIQVIEILEELLGPTVEVMGHHDHYTIVDSGGGRSLLGNLVINGDFWVIDAWPHKLIIDIKNPGGLEKLKNWWIGLAQSDNCPGNL